MAKTMTAYITQASQSGLTTTLNISAVIVTTRESYRGNHRKGSWSVSGGATGSGSFTSGAPANSTTTLFTGTVTATHNSTTGKCSAITLTVNYDPGGWNLTSTASVTPTDISVHTHSYTIDSGVQYSAATCTKNRFNYKKCSCNYNPQSASYIVEVANTKLPHTIVNGGTSSVHQKCSVCGTTTSTTHSYSVDSGVQYSAATCTANKKNYKKCACGYNPKSSSHVVEVANTKLGHSWSTDFKYEDNNNITNGCRFKKCSRCSEKTGIEYHVEVEAGEGIQSTTGTGWYASGGSCSWSATVLPGYTWSKWSDGDTNQSGTSTITQAKHWIAYATINNYYLDLNGLLDDTYQNHISGFGTCDVYINGTAVQTGISDYYSSHPYGSSYEIKNIKATTGHTYDGVYSGELSGTIPIDGTSVQLEFHTNSYTLTFMSDNSKYDSKSVVYDTGYGTLPEPTKLGYVFDGWFTAASGGTQVTADTKIGAADVTVYAHWTKVGAFYQRVNGAYKRVKVFVRSGGVYKESMAYQRDGVSYKN